MEIQCGVLNCWPVLEVPELFRKRELGAATWNSVSSLWHANNKPKGAHWVLSQNSVKAQKQFTELAVYNCALLVRMRPVPEVWTGAHLSTRTLTTEKFSKTIGRLNFIKTRKLSEFTNTLFSFFYRVFCPGDGFSKLAGCAEGDFLLQGQGFLNDFDWRFKIHWPVLACHSARYSLCSRMATPFSALHPSPSLKRGRKIGATQKLSKSVEKYFWQFWVLWRFWTFFACVKTVEKCRSYVWHFLMIFEDV